MANSITRAQVADLCRPGRVITVEYLNLTAVAIGIRLAEHGKASHALCCIGGLDIVEAAVGGVQESNLHNYMRGNCNLTVRGLDLSDEQADTVTNFWSDRVNDPYDMGMIFGEAFILGLSNTVGLVSKPAAMWVLDHVPNALASSHLSTCAELGARGLDRVQPGLFDPLPLSVMDPEILRTTLKVKTFGVLEAPVLEG